MATAKKRIYLTTHLVRDNDAPNTKPVYRLVNAVTQAQAFKHVARELIEVEVPTPHKIAELAGNGVKVEEAGDE